MRRFFTLPPIKNEPLSHYIPGSIERSRVKSAIARLKADLPIRIGSGHFQHVPHDHKVSLCEYSLVNDKDISSVINTALKAKTQWENTPFQTRAAIFLKAADLLTTKYKHEMLAATMIGQSKNVWQAEIDCAAELADFWRFNVKFANRTI
jgi:1-pyrroline-5-carboxylate dehydrogenase